jgi:hypothetical protein
MRRAASGYPSSLSDQSMSGESTHYRGQVLGKRKDQRRSQLQTVYPGCTR